MGPYVFRLPDVGEGVAEAEIVTWHIKPGERLREDDPMVDVMTGKANVEMTAPVSGIVLALHAEVGEMVAVGSTLVELQIDEDATTIGAAEPPQADDRRDTVLASPATRRRAAERGITLDTIKPTGEGGRITAQDFERAAAATSDPRDGKTGITRVPIVGLRRKIAEKLVKSATSIPHITYVEEFDLTELEDLRRALNGERGQEALKLTLLPFFMRALVRLLPLHPRMNAHYDDVAGDLLVHDAVHIGIATQTVDGLMVPVVRHAEARDVWDCAREMARVTSASRTGTAAPDELTGSTVTLTSLGALGGIVATPIINHPEVAIIAPNKLVERPVLKAGAVVGRMLMNVSSSFDHRIVDGHDAARFIQGLKRLMERPALLFMDAGPGRLAPAGLGAEPRSS